MLQEQFIGEIKMFGGDFAPQGWLFCNGQTLPLAQYTNLFKVIGNAFGGDGVKNFALPNLQATAPLGSGQGEGLTNRPFASKGGKTTVTLTERELPKHSHLVSCTEAQASNNNPAAKTWAATKGGQNIYSHADPNTTMSAETIAPAGTGAPHNNMPPYLCVSFIIAIEGLLPERS